MSLQIRQTLGLQLEAALGEVFNTAMKDCTLDMMTASCTETAL